MRLYKREFQYQGCKNKIVKSAEVKGISDYKHTHLHLFYLSTTCKQLAFYLQDMAAGGAESDDSSSSEEEAAKKPRKPKRRKVEIEYELETEQPQKQKVKF